MRHGKGLGRQLAEDHGQEGHDQGGSDDSDLKSEFIGKQAHGQGSADGGSQYGEEVAREDDHAEELFVLVQYALHGYGACVLLVHEGADAYLVDSNEGGLAPGEQGYRDEGGGDDRHVYEKCTWRFHIVTVIFYRVRMKIALVFVYSRPHDPTSINAFMGVFCTVYLKIHRLMHAYLCGFLHKVRRKGMKFSPTKP